MKILAIDPGTRRIGLAACDELEMTTRTLPTLVCQSPGQWLDRVVGRVKEEGFELILMGLPLNMDGSPGPGAKRSQELARALQKKLEAKDISCPVQLWDERLTTFEAEQRLGSEGKRPKKNKENLDSYAAQVLLEDYLRSRQ